MDERKLLQAVTQSKDSFNIVNKYLSEDDFTDRGYIVYKEIQNYYTTDEQVESVDVEILNSRLERKFPKYIDLFKSLLTFTTEISVPNLVQEVIELKKYQIGLRLSTALLDNKTSEIAQLMESYQSCSIDNSEEEEDVIIAAPLDNLMDNFKDANLISVYPNSLNDVLEGGVPVQTHIVIFAEPEVGKSMFSLNMAAGFCRDGRKTLYIGNEDSKDMMQLRIVSRMTGMTKLEILKDMDTAFLKAIDMGYENFMLAPMSGGTIPAIEKLIIKYEPECLIVDQIRHLEFPKVNGEVEQITKAGKAIRALTKKYNLVTISVTQAADSAKNKLILDRGDVYMSNTSLPGDADVLIGIGMNKDYEAQGRRMLSLCKNKISGKHDSFPVAVYPQISKVVSI